MGSSDQSGREAGIARKELTENRRAAVPVIYRCITNLPKLSEVKQHHFICLGTLWVRNSDRAQQGRLSLLQLGRLAGGRLDYLEASSLHVWHLGEEAV